MPCALVSKPPRLAIVGVDQSLTCSGVAYRTDTGLVTTTIEPGKLRGLHRLSYIRNRLTEILEIVQPSMVVFEDYIMGFRKGTGRLAHLGEIGGVLKLAAWSFGADVMIVPSATLKSVVAQDGKAGKLDVQRALLKKYGYRVEQEDEADAAALLLIGEARCGSEELKSSATRMAAVAKCEIQSGQVKLTQPRK